MIKLQVILLCVFISNLLSAQSFHPVPGEVGSIAISKDSNCFIQWANGGTLTRGFLDISDTTIQINSSNKASFGVLENAFGVAEGDGMAIVSLGDSGQITLTFSGLIVDGPGYDFAVFENGFTNNYMEFAHVEVSSDGINFVRFASTSEIPLSPQLTNFTYSDCRMVNNLAGKYRAGFGTPFDINELPDYPYLNKNAISHIRLVDVIGDASGNHSTEDASGTIINDPFPTPFESCGFDLDAVGVINGTLSISELGQSSSIYPNPFKEELFVRFPGEAKLLIYSLNGDSVLTMDHFNETTILDQMLNPGCYLIEIHTAQQQLIKRIVKL